MTNTTCETPVGRPVLTIDTGRLREIWLPAVKADAATVDFLWGEVKSAHLELGRSTHLIRAWDAMRQVYRESVEIVRDRGGLLLIGGGEA